jgi:Flp pilus assembly pilin Flp
MIQRLRSSLLSDERGLTTVEYVIVLCLIAVISVEAWQTLGGNIHRYLDGAINDIETQMTKNG